MQGRNQTRKQHAAAGAAGFSLVEVMMIMMLLTTVTVPMVMMLASQQNNIDQEKNDAVNQVMAGQLFDNLNMSNPDMFAEYPVTNKVLSVYCDPADKTKNVDEYTVSCTGAGKDKDRAPFFQRTLEYTKDTTGSYDYRGVVATVKLFRKATDTTPYYETSRQYDLDHYLVNVGTKFNPSNYSDVVQKIRHFDKIIGGVGLMPDYPLGSLPTATLMPYYSNTPCSASAYVQTADDTLTALLPHGGRSRYFNKAGCATGGTYVFKVTKNKTYRLNLGFIFARGSFGPYTDMLTGQSFSPVSLPGGPGVNCVSGSSGLTCELADVVLKYRPAGSTGFSVLKQFRNFDVGAPVHAVNNSNNKMMVPLTTTVQTPADAMELAIDVRPASVGNGNTYVLLSTIDLTRQDQ